MIVVRHAVSDLVMVAEVKMLRFLLGVSRMERKAEMVWTHSEEGRRKSRRPQRIHGCGEGGHGAGVTYSKRIRGMG